MDQSRRSSHTNLASCIVATIFLISIGIVTVFVFFFLFKPKDPKIAVNAVKFPAFSVSNGTVDFTFSQSVALKNPNRDAFTHYDSSLRLVYSGVQLGVLFIPAGHIDAGRTQFMTATFDVEKFPLPATPDGVTALSEGVGSVGPTLEIESKIKLVGRVRVLHFLTHRVESRVSCSVVIEASNGSVLGFHC